MHYIPRSLTNRQKLRWGECSHMNINYYKLDPPAGPISEGPDTGKYRIYMGEGDARIPLVVGKVQYQQWEAGLRMLERAEMEATLPPSLSTLLQYFQRVTATIDKQKDWANRNSLIPDRMSTTTTTYIEDSIKKIESLVVFLRTVANGKAKKVKVAAVNGTDSENENE